MSHLLFGDLSADDCRPVCLYCKSKLRPAVNAGDYLQIVYHHAVCCGAEPFEHKGFRFIGKPYTFGYDGANVYLLATGLRNYAALYLGGAEVYETATLLARVFVSEVEADGDIRKTALRYRSAHEQTYNSKVPVLYEQAIALYAERLSVALGWPVDQCIQRLTTASDPLDIDSVPEMYHLLLEAR